MAEVQGHCEDKFAKVKRLLQQYVESGDEIGASIAVNIGGCDVIDIWAGYADRQRTKPWERDTIANVWSTTKNIANLAILMLVERGLIDVEEKVSKYWPEFAQNGKEDVRVKHFMSHTSGLASLEEKVQVEDLFDRERVTSLFEKQAPWWTPGSASGYHSYSQGFLLGELVRRVTGKTITQFVAEDMAGPLGADFQIGALEKDWPRIAELESETVGNVGTVKLGPFAIQTFGNPTMKSQYAETPGWRRAEMAAVNGHGNGRSICRMLSPIALGEVDGRRILSDKTVNLIFEEQASGDDLVIGAPVKFGIGFGLPGGVITDEWIKPSGRKCFWAGWGGSIGLVDLDHKMTIGYAMNSMSMGILGNKRTEAYVKAIYAALEGEAPRL